MFHPLPLLSGNLVPPLVLVINTQFRKIKALTEHKFCINVDHLFKHYLFLEKIIHAIDRLYTGKRLRKWGKKT